MHMNTNLITVPPAGGALVTLESLVDQAKAYASRSKAENTKRAYQSDWNTFTSWCTAKGVPSMPAAPSVVGLYLSDCAGRYKTSSLQRHLTAISQAHKAAGHRLDTGHPAIREVWAGIKRTHGVAQEGKAPIMTSDIRAMVATLDGSLLGIRNRALLLLGFAGAYRRSELVGLDVADCEFSRDGLTVTLRRSKTDQEGAGIVKGVPYGSNPDTCPVRALQDWIAAAGLTEGPLFRMLNRHGHLLPGRLSDKGVARIVKETVQACGLDPARYGGHSLRAGFATSAAAAGVEERAIMSQTGHKRTETVRKYIRIGNLFRDNAAGKVGL